MTPFSAADRDIIDENLSNFEVVQYITGKALNKEERDARYRNYQKRSPCGRLGIWLVQNRQSGEKLGTCSFVPMPVDQNEQTRQHKKAIACFLPYINREPFFDE